MIRAALITIAAAATSSSALRGSTFPSGLPARSSAKQWSSWRSGTRMQPIISRVRHMRAQQSSSDTDPSRYSFGAEIEQWKKEQKEKEEQAKIPEDPPKYSFGDEIGLIEKGEEPPRDLGPASWDRPPADPLESLRQDMMAATQAGEQLETKRAAAGSEAQEEKKEKKEEEQDDDEEDDGVPDEPPYLVSEYQAREWVAPRYKPGDLEGVLNEATMLKKSRFILPEDLMIEKAQDVLKALGDGSKMDLMEQLAEDFQFIGPVVGPLDKEGFIRAYNGFQLKEALPDLKENVFGWTVDPMEPNRVWWFSRKIGTHTGKFGGSIQPTGIRVEWPVEVCSVCFDDEGNIYRLTMGYSVDREMGNTGGLGAVFGLLNAIGHPLPFREARPWQPSARFLFFTKAMPRLRDLLKKGKDWREKLLKELDEELD